MLTLRPYRRAAVPLLAIQTADPAEVVRLVMQEATETTSPALVYDCLHGVTALNQSGQAIANVVNGDGIQPEIATSRPDEALKALERLGVEDQATKTIVVMLGMADVLEEPSLRMIAKQGLWNLRDMLTQQGVLLILAVPIGWRNPFPDDIAVAVMPLPNRPELIEKADQLCNAAGIEEADADDEEQIGNALLGLSGFAAEQALALSIAEHKALNIPSLRERKEQKVSETQGLQYYKGKETFNDLGGLDQGKKLFRALLKGKKKYGCVVFIDEGEKAYAGSTTDTSGVSQYIMGSTLTYMQDNEVDGAIFVGHPGAAKSALAKAIGNEGDIPTIILDLGALKGSLLGESERQTRAAFQVITAISGGKPLFIMTCNGINNLPPELKSRYTIGTFFFDLPTTEEQALIWKIYLKKLGLKDKKLPTCEGWTGREIKQCCNMADRLGMSVVEAAEFVVPICISAREKVETLRKEAHGRYLSVAYSGTYKYEPVKTNRSRKLDI